MSPPLGVEKWSWVSYVELQVCCAQILLEAGAVGASEEAVVRYDLTNLMGLNRDDGRGDPDFTWFIAYEGGFLFRKRDSSFCPWKDKALFVPAKWALRVIRAVRMGICEVQWVDLGSLKPTYRPDFKGEKLHNVIELVSPT
ncbi:hypothetical protein EPO17_02765 [Patescibacteria group bacterium]|nr:MAG: hypothetical protein EPO17_02765 [Patescibacteria group bacterium]